MYPGVPVSGYHELMDQEKKVRHKMPHTLETPVFHGQGVNAKPEELCTEDVDSTKVKHDLAFCDLSPSIMRAFAFSVMVV
ncbi:hypothetical protein LTR86_008668 [Recurvomyces mirabilis]|nr:hypothetical protein LTR86_008668 [Recurvomyces mirabilis]